MAKFAELCPDQVGLFSGQATSLDGRTVVVIDWAGETCSILDNGKATLERGVKVGNLVQVFRRKRLFREPEYLVKLVSDPVFEKRFNLGTSY